jgi:hypothetical protein
MDSMKKLLDFVQRLYGATIRESVEV